MEKREQIIKMWFDMWINNDIEPIQSIFDDNILYSESWGPEYLGLTAVKHWFQEWNTRGKVLIWNIKKFIQSENTTVVEWYFENQMNDGRSENFDGVSLIEWSKDNKIVSLKEFGSKLPHYNPYENGKASPTLKNTDMWT